MNKEIKAAEDRLKEAFGEEKFNAWKQKQAEILERNRRQQLQLRQEMFQKMRDTSSEVISRNTRSF